MKINTHPTKPPLLPIPADPTMLPFQSVSMDFITDLPLSNHYDSIMVVMQSARPNYTTITSTNGLAYPNASSLIEDPNLPHESSKPSAHV
ncbi:hypothetical protein M0805_002838 [Coniferiporia weirii]|nr:hypothetical protein M0805_002838 [Coniferiporia weirii]